MRPLSTVTIIEHRNDPRNVIKLPKKERSKRLLVFVGRKGYDTFSDESGSPMGKGFWIEGFSKLQWDYLMTHGGANWILDNGHKYNKVDLHKWLEGWYDHIAKIKLFMLQQLNLDPNKYHIMSWSTEAFKPIPTLHEIKP